MYIVCVSTLIFVINSLRCARLSLTVFQYDYFAWSALFVFLCCPPASSSTTIPRHDNDAPKARCCQGISFSLCVYARAHRHCWLSCFDRFILAFHLPRSLLKVRLFRLLALSLSPFFLLMYDVYMLWCMLAFLLLLTPLNNSSTYIGQIFSFICVSLLRYVKRLIRAATKLNTWTTSIYIWA